MTIEEREKQAQLIEAARSGNKAVLYQLWEALRPLTMRYIAHYITTNRNKYFDENDILQESYIALVAALEYWKPERGAFSNVYLWAIKTRIAALRQRGRDLTERAARLDAPLTADGDEEITLLDAISDPNGETPFEEAEETEYTRQLRTALDGIARDKLNPEQREVIESIYIKGMSRKEAAENAGITYERCIGLERTALNTYRRNVIKLSPYFDGMKDTGLTAYKINGASSTELYAERLDKKGE